MMIHTSIWICALERNIQREIDDERLTVVSALTRHLGDAFFQPLERGEKWLKHFHFQGFYLPGGKTLDHSMQSQMWTIEQCSQIYHEIRHNMHFLARTLLTMMNVDSQLGVINSTTKTRWIQ